MKNENEPAIFTLIQTMDRSEKGYFVKFAKMLGKGGNHIVLFNVLSEMDYFDKEILLKKLKRKKLHISNISVTLHHLYQFTLKSLRLFHEKNYYKIQINNLTSEAEILIGKNLKHQALKLLRKAESLAKEHHLYSILAEIQKTKTIQLVAISKNKLMEAIESSYAELEESVNIFQEEIIFRKIHHLALGCSRINNMDASHQFQEKLNHIINNPLFNDEGIPVSFHAQFYKESAKGIKERIYSDREKANVHYKNIVDIWNSNSAMIKAEPLIYRNVISNYLVNASFIKKIDDFDEQIKKIENIPARFESDRVELFQSKIYLEQVYYLNYKKLDEAYEVIEKNTSLLEKYKSKMNFSRLTIIQYNFLIICFLKGEFSEAIHWLNEILYEKNADPKKDVRLFCRIMELLLHFEMDNYDLLDSLIGSVWRKRKADSSFYEYSESILKHFKSLIKTTSKNKVQILSKEFMGILEGFYGQSPRPIGIEELIFWTKSKIENTSIEEAYMNSDF